jgi:Tol biopolymer transport system component
VEATVAAGPVLPGRLVFLAEDAEEERTGAIVAMRPDGSERKELIRGAGLYPAAVEPNGAALALIAVDEQGGGHAEVLRIVPWTASGLGKPIWESPPSSHVRNPSWGPDGRFIVFEAALDSFRDLYRLDLPAREPGHGSVPAPAKLLRLTDNAEGNFEPAVSADGQHIAFVSSRDGNAEVYAMKSDGSEQRRLTNFPLDDWGPLWAPDGKTIAFLSNREQIDRIYLMGSDGSAQRRFTADQAPVRDPDAPLGDEPHETDPVFGPDGLHLAYCVRVGSQGASLRVAPIAGGAPVVLSDGRFADRSPVWSPDGAALVFVSNRESPALDLFRVARDGSGLARLTDRPGADWLPRWSSR